MKNSNVKKKMEIYSALQLRRSVMGSRIVNSMKMNQIPHRIFANPLLNWTMIFLDSFLYNRDLYCISSYSFCRNFSFLNLEVVENSNTLLPQIYIFFPNKLKFYCWNYSTEEIIWGITVHTFFDYQLFKSEKALFAFCTYTVTS